MRKILLLLLFPTALYAQWPMNKMRSTVTDSVFSQLGPLYVPDSVIISGYAQVNNIEAKSGDMVAIRDTARTSSKMGIGSLTGTIDSALTVFSGADYGGIHVRGIGLTGTLRQSLTYAAGLSNAFTVPTSLTFTDPITSSGSTLGFNAVITEAGASVDRRVTGLRSSITYDATTGTNGSMTGAQLSLTHSGLGSTMSAMTGLEVSMVDGGVSTATNGYGIHIPTMPTAGFTTLYGLKITNVMGGSTNYAIHTGSGSVQLGTLTASRLVATDASKNLVSTITLANFASSVSDVTGTTGTNKFVLDTSPTLVTPNIGAATGTSVNLTGAGTFGGFMQINGATGGLAPFHVKGQSGQDAIFEDAGTTNSWGLNAGANYIWSSASTPGGSYTTRMTLTNTGSLTVTGDVAVNGGDFTTTQSRFTFNKGVAASDTIRAGDFTTYSYFIPGGALVQSSTQEVKKNIRPYTADLTKFSLVTPKRYNFKEEAFLKLFDESTLPDSLSEREKGDIRKQFREDNLKEAQEKSKREMTGFLAEEFNSILGKDSKEINQQDVINVMWLKIQELEARIKTLEAR